jgi:hypothetical protein
VLEVVVALVAVLLVVVGVVIMAGPAVPRALGVLRFRVRSVAPADEPIDASVHPTTGRALSATARLIELLSSHGMRRHATAVRLAGVRLRREEVGGIYAMRDVLRRIRTIHIDDDEDQEIMDGLVAQITRALNDRAEQLELLPGR